MSWGEILFGFHGRINRKTYWIGSLLVALAGLSFNALLTYLATGDPFAPEVWQRPADKSGVWMPLWIAYFLFLAWPTSALSVKRLHDRSRPAWLWYAYFAASIVLTLVPARSTAGGELNPAAGAILLMMLGFGLYIIFELSILRGVPGANEHGEDTMPPGYYGGDYSFLSWMLALEGRISRARWWFGMLILNGVIVAASMAIVLVVGAFQARHPGIENNLSNPEWIDSKEAAPLVFELGALMIVPLLALILTAWSFFALGAKRLHDRGLSTWLILVVVLPFFAALISPAIAPELDAGENFVLLTYLLLLASAIWSVLQFGIFKGQTGPNEHGPDPLAGR